MSFTSAAFWRISVGPQNAMELSSNWPYCVSVLTLSGPRWTLVPVNSRLPSLRNFLEFTEGFPLLWSQNPPALGGIHLL